MKKQQDRYFDQAQRAALMGGIKELEKIEKTLSPKKLSELKSILVIIADKRHDELAVKMTQKVLSIRPEWIDHKDTNGYTALMVAAAKGSYGLLTLLLEHGANPWTRRAGENALTLAGTDDSDIDAEQICRDILRFASVSQKKRQASL